MAKRCTCADRFGPMRGTVGCPVHRQTVRTGKGSTIGNSGQAMMFAGRIAPAETRQHARYVPRPMHVYTVHARDRATGQRVRFPDVRARDPKHAVSVLRTRAAMAKRGQGTFDAAFRVTRVERTDV